jgi:hypothetical protein
MFSNLFNSTSKKVHCEITGEKISLEHTRILTKINGVINLKLFRNPYVDELQKIIYSDNQPPMNYFSKLSVPSSLYGIIGDLYSIVEDEDDLEQSTNILSKDGVDLFMHNQLSQLVEYLKKNHVVKFSEHVFFVSIDDPKGFNVVEKKCAYWDVPFLSIGRKYTSKKILETRIEKQRYGIPGILSSGFDVAFSDVSSKHIIGTGYQFRTENKFNSLDLCSNESAVGYCLKNNTLVYFCDFLNLGRMRLLSRYSEDINTNLQNSYKFRSSNI